MYCLPYFFICVSSVFFPRVCLGVHFNATPPVPSVGDLCTLVCQTTLRTPQYIGIDFYSPKDDQSKIQRISYSFPTNKLAYKGNLWPVKKALDVTTQPETGSFKVAFIATPSDRGKYQCVDNLTETVRSQAFVDLNVQQLPAVLNLSITNPDKTASTFLVAGELKRFVCTARLGMPHAADLEMNAPGELISEQKTTLHTLDAFGYRDATAETQHRLRAEDNGQRANCSLSNSLGLAHRSMEMDILFPPQNIKWSNDPPTSYAVGKQIVAVPDMTLTITVEGNPTPNLMIRVNHPTSQKWTQPSYWGRGEAKVKIPPDALLGMYSVKFSARNVVVQNLSEIVANTTLRVTAPMTSSVEITMKTWIFASLGMSVFVILGGFTVAFLRVTTKDADQ